MNDTAPTKRRPSAMTSAANIGRALLSISLLSIFVVGTGAFLLSYHSLHQQTERHLRTLISFTASESSSAIEFRDSKTATEILNSIPLEEGLVSAEIRDASGIVLANFDRWPKGWIGALAALIGNERVHQDVILDGKRIGSVALEGGSEPMLMTLMVLFVWFAFGMMLFAIFALVAGRRYTSRFTRPILQLKAVVQDLIDDRDFSRRAPPSSLNEVEDLRLEFNILLDEIVLRDHLLTQSNEALRRAAYLDALTGLPNRAMFDPAMRTAINTCDRERTRACLFYLDVDAFKSINDNFGHAVGDELLRQLASRLRAWRPQETLSARLGGDEFVILLTPLAEHVEIAPILSDLHKALEQPIQHDDIVIQPRISIGAAIYPDNAPSVDEFVRRADQMMYVAKSRHYQNSRITNWKTFPAVSTASSKIFE